MKVNAMIRVRENMDIVVLDGRQIQLVEEGQRILHVDVVVRDAVHDEEADGVCEGGGV
jgi:hypothetical protein